MKPTVEFDIPPDRARLGWWAFVGVLTLVAAYIAASFVGVIVLGVFGYYATRPICTRLARYTDSPGLAAITTVVVVVVPILLLVLYTGFRIFQQVRLFLSSGSDTGSLPYFDLSALPADQRRTVTSLLQNPGQFVSQPDQLLDSLPRILSEGTKLVSGIFGGLLLIALAVAFAFFLLENDHRFAAGFRELVGGRDTVAYAYASAVDADLESVFFGNVLFVATMAVIGGIVYEATNLLAPAGLHIPLVLPIAVLTGLTSLLPIIVSKVVYLPVIAYLGVQALNASGSAFVFVGIALVIYFLVLDILPQTFIQPYITGRRLDMIMLMFAYVLGPTLFGWYGFFLLPIVFVVILEVIRIVLPELVRGDPLTPTVTLGADIGSEPVVMEDDSSADDATDEADDDATADAN